VRTVGLQHRSAGAEGQDVFDAHLHIVDPRFPIVANMGYLPTPFRVSDYVAVAQPLGICGGAVVSGSFQGFDQTYLLDAIGRLGPTFVGVTQLPVTVSDDEILALAGRGVRALRFNLRRGGSASAAELPTMARRVYELAGWHVELYVDSADLAALLPTLHTLPALCIDHLGLSHAGRRDLLRLVGHGAKVKASGFGRVDFPVADILRAIDAENPSALMFGSDLPSTRAPRPFAASDLDLIIDALGAAGARRVLWENAYEFYGMRRRAA
jgi:predicted TIM-barrel fold metal-dependent hydrolase